MSEQINETFLTNFYQVYAGDQIGQTFSDQFSNLPAVSTVRKFPLSWSHYLKLMGIDNTDENPTIGVLLCQQKSDALVELTLPADSDICALKYELYLPDKKELQEKLREWIAEETRGEEL